QAGLIKRAAAEHHIDLADSWLIYNILDDVQAGDATGCMSILIDSGKDPESTDTRPYRIAANLLEATEMILFSDWSSRRRGELFGEGESTSKHNTYRGPHASFTPSRERDQPNRKAGI